MIAQIRGIRQTARIFFICVYNVHLWSVQSCSVQIVHKCYGTLGHFNTCLCRHLFQGMNRLTFQPCRSTSRVCCLSVDCCGSEPAPASFLPSPYHVWKVCHRSVADRPSPTMPSPARFGFSSPFNATWWQLPEDRPILHRHR